MSLPIWSLIVLYSYPVLETHADDGLSGNYRICNMRQNTTTNPAVESWSIRVIQNEIIVLPSKSNSGWWYRALTISKTLYRCWISFALMQHNYRKSLSSHNLQYPHQEYSYLLSIFYHISTYQISLHISDAIRGCMIPCELHHLPCLWLSYQCKLLSHYCRMRDEGSTQHLPPELNDIRSHNRSSVVIAPFKTEVMKSENNTIEISYRLSVIVLVSKWENWCVVIQRTNNRYARSVVS